MIIPLWFPELVAKPSGNHGGKFAPVPRILIMHYTAGTSLESATAWLRTPASVASAHWILGVDGKGNQLVPNDTVAWHAGKSRWRDMVSMNHYAWGLELVNPGPCTLLNGKWYAGGKPVLLPFVGKHKNGTSAVTHWAPYPEAQIAGAVALARKLGVNEIIGHDDVAPERKIDPGPAFPMEEFRRRVFA